jgi:hypothetical protein
LELFIYGKLFKIFSITSIFILDKYCLVTIIQTFVSKMRTLKITNFPVNYLKFKIVVFGNKISSFRVIKHVIKIIVHDNVFKYIITIIIVVINSNVYINIL